MTREQREQELVGMMRTNPGKLLDLYRSAIGMPAGVLPVAGTMMGQTMIPAILDKEFPTATNPPNPN